MTIFGDVVNPGGARNDDLRARQVTRLIKMGAAVIGFLIAVAIFAVWGGHVLFLPLFFLLPLGGLFGHRRRRRRF